MVRYMVDSKRQILRIFRTSGKIEEYPVGCSRYYDILNIIQNPDATDDMLNKIDSIPDIELGYMAFMFTDLDYGDEHSFLHTDLMDNSCQLNGQTIWLSGYYCWLLKWYGSVPEMRNLIGTMLFRRVSIPDTVGIYMSDGNRNKMWDDVRGFGIIDANTTLDKLSQRDTTKYLNELIVNSNDVYELKDGVMEYLDELGFNSLVVAFSLIDSEIYSIDRKLIKVVINTLCTAIYSKKGY